MFHHCKEFLWVWYPAQNIQVPVIAIAIVQLENMRKDTALTLLLQGMTPSSHHFETPFH